MPTTQLSKTIALLYRMEDSDTEALYNQLLDARKQAWSTALRSTAQEHGCNQVPNAPRKDDLAELKRMSRADAESIAKTYNFDVEVQIERIFEETRTANRATFYKRLEDWNTQRNSWKLPQIALVTETTTTEYARTRFREANYPAGTQYVFDGPPTVCEDCTTRYAAGVVDENYTQMYPCPRHPNCPHTWRALTPPKLDCGELWLG